MKTNKIKIVLLMVLLFAPAVYADRIIILNLHYDNGKVSVLDKIETYGYSPDRMIQPDIGYRAEIISEDDAVMKSFKFKVPLEHYTDIQEEGTLHGGMVVVDETDFALIIPSLPNAKEIRFYNEEDAEVLSVGLAEEKEFPKTLVIVGALILLMVIVLIIIGKKRKTLSTKII